MLTVLNNYAHGYVVVPVVLACRKAGLFDYLTIRKEIAFCELVDGLKTNEGHLRVAMQMLESLGWVYRSNQDGYILTQESNVYKKFPKNINLLTSLSIKEYLSIANSNTSLKRWIELSCRKWDIEEPHIVEMLDGVLITPLLLELTQAGSPSKITKLEDVWGSRELPPHVEAELIKLFAYHGWLEDSPGKETLSKKGAFVFERSLVLAIVASYKPMLSNIYEIIFGDCKTIFGRDESGHEMHLDRTLNVIGSGYQHQKYFSDLEKIVIEIFNKDPIDSQPKYIADMGCGDGTLLKQVYEVIKNRTRRGDVLQEHPVKLIGVDYNEKALQATSQTLEGADYITVKGDIGDPEQLIEDLKSLGISDSENVLHIRSFLDHDRPFIAPSDIDALDNRSKIAHGSVFVNREGKEIPASIVIQSLVEHLRRWARIIGNNSIIILEVHSLEPDVIRKNISKSENLHFDAYHRFSHQMLVSANSFLLAAAEAGLFPENNTIKKYPKTLEFNRITLTRFERRGYRIRHALPKDFPVLELLEQECWDVGLRMPLSVLKNRIERYPKGQFVLETDDGVLGVIYSQRICGANCLNDAVFESVDDLYASDGKTVQLLSVNILPKSQHLKFGDQLLEFMLQFCELSNDVEKIVGITRCKDYGKYPHINKSEYIALKNSDDLYIDRVLRFHQLHGAEVKKLISGYRPKDLENECFGVLIEYDVQNRKRLDMNSGGMQRTAPKSVTTVDNCESIENFLVQVVCQIIEVDSSSISFKTPLMEMGLDSTGLMELGSVIGSRFNTKLEATFFFEQNTLSKIVSYIETKFGNDNDYEASQTTDSVAQPSLKRVRSNSTTSCELPVSMDKAASGGIAIIGVSCNLPGGIVKKEQLWELLVSQKSAVAKMPQSRWRWPSNVDPETNSKGINYLGYLDAMDCFDASFFNISPAEAEFMDPQQRILLELSWECVEDAGYDANTLAGSSTGVFIGVSGSDYKTLYDKQFKKIDAHYAIGHSTSVIPNRISYFFDFCGPSLQVDTACSSSLVAIDQAIKSIREGECMQALVGSVNLICNPNNSISYYKAGMLSKDGKCKTFDKNANGYVRGEGAVMFLLKPLDRAITDKDNIYGTIIGSSVNHGGRAAGLTVPNPVKQADLLVRAYKKAGVASESVGYIEAHGTGTSLGDPIEVKGLVTAFSELSESTKNERRHSCGLGSIKTNIGHLEASAGAAGLLKVLLSLQHKKIPATLNFNHFNPKISIEGTPFYIPRKSQVWDLKEGQSLRVAGVSSFGSGGTNAHIVLEEYPAISRVANDDQGKYLALLSAKCETTLKQKKRDLLAWLKGEGRNENIFDICAALSIGRAHFETRSAFIVGNNNDLINLLEKSVQENSIEKGVDSGSQIPNLKKNAFFNSLSKKIIKNFTFHRRKNSQEYIDDLVNLFDIYLAGYDFDWNKLYGDTMFRRLNLPTYPFLKERYWLPDIGIECIDGKEVDVKEATAKLSPFFAYQTIWQPLEITSVAQQSITAVVFYIDENFADGFRQIKQENQQTQFVFVKLSNEFRLIGQSTFEIDAQKEMDYLALLHLLQKNSAFPIVFICQAVAEKTPSALSKDADELTSLFDSGNKTTLKYVYQLVKAIKQAKAQNIKKIIVTYEQDPVSPNPCVESIGGYARSLQAVGLRLSKIAWVGFHKIYDQIAARLVKEAAIPVDGDGVFHEIRYENWLRYIKAARPVSINLQTTTLSLIKKQGVYLITGGCGKLGFQFAQYLAKNYQAKLILTGRSPMDDRKQERLNRLEQMGAKVTYFRCNVADYQSMQDLLQSARLKYGHLQGVIHAAGTFREDKLIHEKEWSSVLETLSSKIAGTLVLDAVTRDEKLDFFVMFSSISALLGDFGQCDYAIANRYMDDFTLLRNRWKKTGKRFGKTISINWPLWKEGGMMYDPQIRETYVKSSGLDCLEIEQGLRIFEACLRDNKEQVIVLVGRESRIEQLLGLNNAYHPPQEIVVEPSSMTQNADDTAYNINAETGLLERLKNDIKNIISNILKIKPEKLRSNKNFADYGFDSIRLKLFADRLSERYKSNINPSIFFEHTSIGELSLFLQSSYREELTTYYNLDRKNASKNVLASIGDSWESSSKISQKPVQTVPTQPIYTSNAERNRPLLSQELIAIIGISGIMPGSPDLDIFWKNLLANKDLISEIPIERWDWREYYGDPTQDKTKTHSKWGGFIEGVDLFDPLFFNISPKEAEMMDPQHRLFLQTAWHCIEDAGYPPSKFSGDRVGVFVGVQFQEYQALIDKYLHESNPQVATGNAHSMLANRVSYLLNFKGPSEAIDTACSSSLVAIHRAVKSIQQGESCYAIAGGVSLMLSPDTFVSTDQMGILSADGRCKTFDKRANGYVKGEGVGALLLKPLSQAKAAGDHIYGIIKGSGARHGGKTSSLTAPSPKAQSELLIDLYEQAGIEPESISYIETHGTGTELGDPVEIEGLKQTFSALSKEQNNQSAPYCALGAVKTNIGHLEPAAGIAGIFKVLLAMKHQKLPRIMNLEEPNPYIALKNSPFYLLKETCDWLPGKDVSGRVIPRRAGVSSFGFGGVNSHLVLEEYVKQESSGDLGIEAVGPQLILLSAKNKDRLKEVVNNLKTYLTNNQDNAHLSHIAYTLQVGRESMEERLAVIVSSKQELMQALNAYLEDEKDNRITIYRGRLKKEGLESSLLEDDEDAAMVIQSIIKIWIKKGKVEKIAKIWTEGIDINWPHLFEGLYEGLTPQRISLPVYPFAKESYWLSIDQPQQRPEQKIGASLLAESQKTTCLLTKDWKPAALQSVVSERPQGNVLIMVNHETLSLGKILFAGDKNSIVICTRDNEGNILLNKAKEENAYELDSLSADSGATVLEKIITRSGLPGCVIDLSDFYQKGQSNDPSVAGKISFYQELIRNTGTQKISILHLTRGLQPMQSTVNSLVGATIAGLMRMLNAEYGKVAAKTIDLDYDVTDIDAIKSLLTQELSTFTKETELCYRRQQRYIPYMTPVDAPPSHFTIDPDKVLVITGGTGGIAFEIADYMVSKGCRKMVIMGRKPIPDKEKWQSIMKDHTQPQEMRDKLKRLSALEEKGITLYLYSGSLTDAARLTQYFEKIRQEAGDIGGVIHCAGLFRDKNPAFINKTAEDIQAVFEPKIDGLLILDQIFQKDKLKFFILFSSVSGVVPRLASGHSDYAAANSFMDYFVSYQRSQGRHYYQSLQWPSWKETGMGENKSPIYRQMGWIAHTNREGIKLFEEACRLNQFATLLPCVVEKQIFEISSLLWGRKDSKPPMGLQKDSDISSTIASPLNLETGRLPWLKGIFSSTLKIPQEKLADDISFAEYGVDSILLAELVRNLEKELGVSLEPSILIEHRTLIRLTQYLTVQVLGKSGGGDQSKVTNKKINVRPTDKKNNLLQPSKTVQFTGNSSQKIAVIGMGCHFPQAQNKTAYWQNLAGGKDCIVEIPASRWDINRFYHPTYKKGKNISKWGGFIEGIEYFDPGYFNIREEDAPQIDPLERQILEISVQTMRDAGYEKEDLWGKKVGVFVGTRIANYWDRLKEPHKNSIIGLGQNFIAAHIAHLFNFRGPNMVVDTACSSSLVSIHLACQSLLTGESEIALAGGVDILLDERPYLILSEARALSPDGKCHTFDQKANGFVPGEGCGAVLLKPLERAIADGDIIYGVIDSTAVNNDGNTMGVTTPNPEAQQDVIREALTKIAIDPASISYIETHGTGTMIGDPMELRALTRIFKEYTQENQFCGVGSVKTNLGHLLSAAGIASFIKVLLSLYNRQLPPTLNCHQPNPRFEFNTSPFYINTKLTDWKPRNGVRRAGISSFGFGGTNAHLIVSDEVGLAHYQPQRHSLSPVEFRKKYYWLEKEQRISSVQSDDSNRISEQPQEQFSSFFKAVEVEQPQKQFSSFFEAVEVESL